MRPEAWVFKKKMASKICEKIDKTSKKCPCKRDKNVPSAFLKKNHVLPILAKNCPKLDFLAQNAQK